MKHHLFLLLLLPVWLNAQTVRPKLEPSTKSIVPLSAESSGKADPVTYAVVIGISDYQDPEIPDLRFGAADAEAFATYLRSSSGGNLDQAHLTLLTNEQATAGRVATALEALLDHVKEGEQVIIYFSGHGDVERKKISQAGFLLCWDSPSRVYTGGGTYALVSLQELVTTLTLQNKAKVKVITDACHAGKLSGSQIGGVQMTASNLARQFANEVKILSCLPNEFSLEGEQWGGGRGCFSYHLVEGLYGLADRNSDGVVSVSEIDRYLEDQVTPEAAPHPQSPMVIGIKTDKLANVNTALLDQLKQYKRGEIPQFTPTEGRVFEENLLTGFSPVAIETKVDSGVWGIYHQFKLAIQEKRFLEPAEDCAEYYYRQLADNESIAPLHGFIKRNYAAALQDEAQQAINAVLKINLPELTRSNLERAKKYRQFPFLLARAAEIIGPSHYMYKTIRARQVLFEGLLLFLDTYASRDPESGQLVLDKYRQSLIWDQEFPVTYYYMSLCYAIKMNQPDSAIAYSHLATQHAETWVIPYAHLGYCLSRYYPERYTDAKNLLDKAMAIDSNNVSVWISLGSVYHYQRQFKQAEAAYRYALKLDSSNAITWANLGVELIQTSQYEAAESALQRSMDINPKQVFARYVLGCMYLLWQKSSEAEVIFLQALQINPGHTASRDSLAHLYLSQKKWKEAEYHFLELTRHNPNYPSAWYQLACLAAMDGRKEPALEYLENAILKGKIDYGAIIQESRLTSMLETEVFKALMQKYYPDQQKN